MKLPVAVVATRLSVQDKDRIIDCIVRNANMFPKREK
jgi:hypothetical protein